MPDVSVIISSHNAPQYLGPAIESVLAQTVPASEVLVVDDSQDESPRLVERYAAQTAGRVRLLAVPPCNISQARNLGLEQVRGQFVAFLDGDDIWLPDRVQRQLDLLDQHPQAVGAWCRYFDFRDRLDDMGRRQTKSTSDDPTLIQVLQWSDIPASTQLIRTQALGSIRFDERSGHGEDVILAGDLRLRGPWRLVDEALVGKRLHGQQVTRTAWHHVWSAQTRIRWCREHADAIGADLAQRIADGIGYALVGHLEHLYWKRQLRDLDAMRQAAAELCPEILAGSVLAKARIYPRWMYRIRDALPVSR
jgi:glycosyltransferase involved in cell wall biosynthesis